MKVTAVEGTVENGQVKLPAGVPIPDVGSLRLAHPEQAVDFVKEVVMSEQEINEIVWDFAKESATRGPGWAQEDVVLRAIGDRIARDHGGSLDQETQQAILNAWHDLFLEKRLAWGYDLDNPNSPFFHVRHVR